MITNDICKTCDGKCCTGCKYFNKVSGCSLEYDARYPSCKIYPFVFTKGGTLALEVTCPGWRVFGEMYEEACELTNREAG